ncbi:MAG: hypothetical protein ACK4SZ_05980 [Allosphingosinicella sp.]|uniref:hypothetical protein n=1 Tax=Allosphingosinicella sp. TaxID=2823234 RepID=UPI003953763C
MITLIPKVSCSMRKPLLGFLIGISLACSGAAAEPAVEGDARDENSVLRSMGAKPIAALGTDAVRFSTEPQLGGKAIVVETARSSNGPHQVRVRRFNGHFREGWSADGEWNFRISEQQYRALTSRIDYLLTLPDPRPNCDEVAEGECMYVCTDGPGILVERAIGIRSFWRRGSCGPRHPNDLAEELIRHLVRRNLGRRVYPSS